jgi:hypothetical protein
MYIAGLHVPITGSQAIEGFAWSTTAFFVSIMARKARHVRLYEGHTSAGVVKTMPKAWLGNNITALHTLSIMAPPVVYTLAIPLGKFVRPEWFTNFDLPGLDNAETYVCSFFYSRDVLIVSNSQALYSRRGWAGIRWYYGADVCELYRAWTSASSDRRKHSLFTIPDRHQRMLWHLM